MTVRSSVLRRRLRLVYMADVSYDELTLSMAGRDSSVGMATRYGLDGPDIESQWGGRNIPHPFTSALGLTQSLIQGL